MEYEDFMALKGGDKVTLEVNVDREFAPEVGTVMYRSKNWLDDDKTLCFEFDIDGKADYSFFSHHEVEVVNE